MQSGQQGHNYIAGIIEAARTLDRIGGVSDGKVTVYMHIHYHNISATITY